MKTLTALLFLAGAMVLNYLMVCYFQPLTRELSRLEIAALLVAGMAVLIGAAKLYEALFEHKDSET